LTRYTNWTSRGKIPSCLTKHGLPKLPNFEVQLHVVSQKTPARIGEYLFAVGQCDGLLVAILAPKLSLVEI